MQVIQSQYTRTWGRECGKRRRRQDGSAEGNATKRQQFAAISVKFVDGIKVYKVNVIVCML